MTERVQRLRTESLETPITISAERAELMTEFYRENIGKHSTPMLRARALEHLYRHQTVYIGPEELIVGERGPAPRAVSTYPELTCHSEEDLRILNRRPKTRYGVSEEAIRTYREKVIPFWTGRTMRERIFAGLSEEWQAAYKAGLFTEFMEQRAPGHTTLDGKFYDKGLRDFQQDIDASLAAVDFQHDPQAAARREELTAMRVACDAVILFARRHAEEAERQAADCASPERQAELRCIAETCRHVPAQAPRSFREALQMYWFMHLATITELNGWDAMNPGHLDRYFFPFYQRDCEAGLLDRDRAKELLQCFWIKFNNHPAPPKVGVTAEESGTYNDFTNINLGGILPDGRDGVNELSYLMLEVMDEIHLLQPQGNIQLSRKNPDRFLKAACRVIRNGYGYPSVFNADGVVEQMVRCGKRIEDAREGGTSGCVETGAFGKEAYILTGYLNVPKILELALHDGVDPRTGRRLGPATGDPRTFATFEELLAAFERQVRHFVDLKVTGNQFIEQLYAREMPAVFLSVLIDDCIVRGLDYNAGGARYNTSYIQCVGIGTVTDSLSAIRTHVFGQGVGRQETGDGRQETGDGRQVSGVGRREAGGESGETGQKVSEKLVPLSDLLTALSKDFEGADALQGRLADETPRYGNDHDEADAVMQRVFNLLVDAIDGRPNSRGGQYHVDMLPTTCHIYFGSVLGATPDGRKAGTPVSEGISPVQGADRNGPTAVIQSAAKMDQLRTGGTLLNMKFLPGTLQHEEGIAKLGQLVRTYFRMDGHHVQFNVVDAETLLEAQRHPAQHRDLIVRVAGYSDYFCDLGRELQDEIILRTAHHELG